MESISLSDLVLPAFSFFGPEHQRLSIQVAFLFIFPILLMDYEPNHTFFPPSEKNVFVLEDRGSFTHSHLEGEGKMHEINLSTKDGYHQ